MSSTIRSTGRLAGMVFGTLVLISALLSGAATAQQYYRWTDENGVVHFSQNPPPDRDAQLEAVRATHITRGMGGMSESSNEAAQIAGSQPASGDMAAAQDPRAPTSNEEMCQRINNGLSDLQSRPRVRMSDPDTGEITTIAGEDLEAERQRLLDLQAQHCQ